MNDARPGIIALASKIETLSAWRQRGLAFGAGVLSVLSMPPFHFWPVLWITLPVLCVLIEQAGQAVPATSRWAPWRRSSLGRAAETGWWFGFGYYLAGLFWIAEPFLIEAEIFAWLLPFAVTLMPAGLALFTAFATALAHTAKKFTPFERVLVLACAFGITEWLRGNILTGFPWNVLGYALTYPLALMQSASVFGIYGLTVLAVIIFAGPFALLRSKALGPHTSTQKYAPLVCAIVPLALMFAFGAWRMSTPAPAAADAQRPKIRMVQTSVAQRDRMQPENRRSIFDDYLARSQMAPDGSIDNAAGIDLIVWPEAALPFLPLAEPVALAEIGQLLQGGTRLITGALRLETDPRPQERRVYNSLLVFEGGAPARHLGTYDKMHLVPFGEYLPAQGLLEAIGLQQITRQRGGFAKGEGPRMSLDISGIGRMWPLICYEAVFPQDTRLGNDRPDLLLTLTNDGWFGTITGPWQHYHQARVRAVETGVPMLRASGNGISAMIDPHGREQGRLELNAVGTLDARIPTRLQRPVYATFGDMIFLSLIAVFGAAIAARNRHHRIEM